MEETPSRHNNSSKTKIKYNCDFCKKSAYLRKDKHFCSMDCYSKFRKEQLPFYQQPSYKGVRSIGESKQIYYNRYRKNNPERIAHLKARRYAREKGAEGSHSLEEWNLLKLKHNNCCAICKKNHQINKRSYNTANQRRIRLY